MIDGFWNEMLARILPGRRSTMDDSLQRFGGRAAAAVPLGYHRQLFVRQRFELGEMFGFEARNRYEVVSEGGAQVAYAAEQQKGFLGFLFRQSLGHWRTFDIRFFTPDRVPFMTARHPFRWFFQRLEVYDEAGVLVGAIQRRFSVLTKRFDVQDANGHVIMEVSSPFWRLWTFLFVARGAEVACVRKKWSGLLAEAFTDKDNFAVDFGGGTLGENERRLVLAAALYIDLMYFEKKASSGLAIPAIQID
jgi:uncharacterized protein YxjI